MLSLFSGLDTGLIVSLVLALTFVLAFEFINGFHDTANAVATVIYTKAMTPNLAVFSSGVFNFLGVLLGGVGVAYAIVHLLPVELLINVDTGQGLAMVFSLLAAAILWNLGTWYLGIPASSSHTLIGSILGVGLANALLTEITVAEGVNWQKAADIGLSLLLSPIAGFAVAGLLLIGLKLWKPQSTMHTSPEQRAELHRRERLGFEGIEHEARPFRTGHQRSVGRLADHGFGLEEGAQEALAGSSIARGGQGFDGGEGRRALDYFSSDEFDPDFLPWPRPLMCRKAKSKPRSNSLMCR